eukprot:4295514-Pyramimonas_sp.AAC.1
MLRPGTWGREQLFRVPFQRWVREVMVCQWRTQTQTGFAERPASRRVWPALARGCVGEWPPAVLVQ